MLLPLDPCDGMEYSEAVVNKLTESNPTELDETEINGIDLEDEKPRCSEPPETNDSGANKPKKTSLEIRAVLEF